jgi:ATP phosphoribosyltransferase
MAPVAERLTLALPKGRIAQQAVPLLARAGIDLAPFLADQADRRLMFDLADDTRVLLVKPSDVPTYVEHGIADLGIAGRDTLLEEARDLYEPLDLGIGRCRMAIAEPRDRPARLQRGAVLRVATKYPRIATRHYRERGLQPEVIPLAGSIELAAVTGLADQIVDLVESGETLRQNGLVVVETICEITSRLVVHPASLKLEGPRISRIVDALANAVASEGRAAS